LGGFCTKLASYLFQPRLRQLLIAAEVGFVQPPANTPVRVPVPAIALLFAAGGEAANLRLDTKTRIGGIGKPLPPGVTLDRHSRAAHVQSTVAQRWNCFLGHRLPSCYLTQHEYTTIR
jgi:hypothetical protein